MCNRLHSNSKLIPETGMGWKMFCIRNFQVVSILGEEYRFDPNGAVIWDGIAHKHSNGFCFFLTKEEAERANNLWNRYSRYSKANRDTVVLKIQYYQGLGTHSEDNFISNEVINIALCKKFKLRFDNE